MFKDTEILQNLQHTQVTLSTIGAVVNTLLQKIDNLQEQVNYLATAEEARATHSKKPTRKPKSEETVTNDAV